MTSGAFVSGGKMAMPTMSRLWIITERKHLVKTEVLDPIHPGEILQEDFLQPLGISINRLAREIGVPAGRISTIVNGKRSITADTALRLGMYFGVSPELWLNLQSDYDLRIARRNTELHITPLKLAA